MVRSLRKGHSSVYLQHAGTGHTIGAEKFQCEVVSDDLVVKFTLRPSGGNQIQDTEYSAEHPIQYIVIDDAYILEELRKYLANNYPRQQFSWRIELQFPRKRVALSVTPKKYANDSLQLLVSSNDG